MDFDSLMRPLGAPVAVPDRQQFGFSPPAADGDDSHWRHVGGICEATRDECRAFDRACHEIDSDPDLTDSGKAKRRAQAAKEHEATLARQDRMIADAATRLEAEGSKVRATLDGAGKSDELTVALGIEYRLTLRTMSHEERQAEVLQAISDRNTTKLNAILGGLPQSSGLIDSGGGLLHMARRALVAAAHGPDVHDRLERYAATIHAAATGVQAARGYLKARAG